ncbi:hypothetical protein NIES2098_39370 [Calothrix sp. NIES-2098]|nr:hypothetical protein NIES2098_39370 [Calothrix sp. NIES-2098]
MWGVWEVWGVWGGGDKGAGEEMPNAPYPFSSNDSVLII